MENTGEAVLLFLKFKRVRFLGFIFEGEGGGGESRGHKFLEAGKSKWVKVEKGEREKTGQNLGRGESKMTQGEIVL